MDLTEYVTPHFLRLVRNGNLPGASSEERQCWRIARAILDNAPGLDCQAQAGIREWLTFVVNHYDCADEFLRECRG
jgi:hypothetical protein